MKISDLKENPKNPRSITDENLEKLCKSIKNFEKMLSLRPMIIDENNIVLGGNMRLQALKKLDYKEIPDEWVKKISDLTEKEKNQFIIKDNIEYGQWDEEILKTEFGLLELEEFDINIDIDFSEDFFEEKNLDDTEENNELKDCKIEIECKIEEKEELKSFLEKKLKETSLYAKIK